MSHQERHDLVIIGAGPAGSGLAAALAGHGWDVLLIERDRFPRHKVCGEFLSPEAQDSLRAVGLFDAIAAKQPQALTQVCITTPVGTTVEVPLPGVAWGISRYCLDQTMAQTVQQRGTTLWTGVTVHRLERSAAGWQVYWQTAQQSGVVTARAVVAACGRHTGAGLPPHAPPSRPTLLLGVKAHYRGVTLPPQVGLFLFPGGYAGVNAVEGGCVNVCLLASYTALARAGRQPTALLTAAANWNPAFGRYIAQATLLPETVVTVAPVDPYRRAQPWDEVACLGDTATMIPPLCGDGMAMALRSAELCAPLAQAFLRGELTCTAWAAHYARDWHAEFDHRLRVGRFLQRTLNQRLTAEFLFRLGRRAPILASYLVKATRGRADW